MAIHRLSTTTAASVAELGSVASDLLSAMSAQNRAPTTESAVDAGAVSKADIEALIARHYAGLRLLIARRTGDPQAAADLLNEAICTSWEKWQKGQIQRPEQMAGFIFRVALNLLRNQRRRMPARLETRISTGQYEAVAGVEKPDDLSIEDQMAARVKKLISGMHAHRDRIVLTRFYLQEEDKKSICQDLGLDSTQFDKVLHRARLRLRELLEAQGVKKSDLFAQWS